MRREWRCCCCCWEGNGCGCGETTILEEMCLESLLALLSILIVLSFVVVMGGSVGLCLCFAFCLRTFWFSFRGARTKVLFDHPREGAAEFVRIFRTVKKAAFFGICQVHLI